MAYNSDNIIVEGLANTKGFRTQAQILSTVSGTLSLTASSEMVVIFTGTTSGQIVKLPDATTIQEGHRYEIFNKSSNVITIQDGAGAGIFNLSSGSSVLFVLQVPGTIAGVWARNAYSSSPFSGTAVITCGYSGNAVATRYLEFVSGNSSDNCPFVAITAYTIVGLSIGGTSASTCTVSLFKNGNFTTPIASLSTVANNNQYTATLNVPLAASDLLTVAITSGSIGKPFVNVYLLGA